MSDWRPSSPAETARRRAAMLRRARHYFGAEQVLEVDTPALSTATGSDPNIEALSVRTGVGGEYYLHTSPEFYMKRLLADGYPDIFSICRVYRDGEVGSRHLAEFTMLEWYRLGFGLGDMVADTVHLIAACLDQPTLLETRVTYDYRAAFQRFAEDLRMSRCCAFGFGVEPELLAVRGKLRGVQQHGAVTMDIVVATGGGNGPDPGHQPPGVQFEPDVGERGAVGRNAMQVMPEPVGRRAVVRDPERRAALERQPVEVAVFGGDEEPASVGRNHVVVVDVLHRGGIDLGRRPAAVGRDPVELATAVEDQPAAVRAPVRCLDPPVGRADHPDRCAIAAGNDQLGALTGSEAGRRGEGDVRRRGHGQAPRSVILARRQDRLRQG